MGPNRERAQVAGLRDLSDPDQSGPGSRPGAPMTPTISILIASYNRRADLRRCLQSLAAIHKPIVEIIVIDDGSSDGTAKMVRGEFPKVAIYQADRNLGLAKARNIAARMSRGTYLWYLDSDAELLDPALAGQFVALMEARPELGALGGEAVLDVERQVIGTKTLAADPNGMVRGDYLVGGQPLDVIPATFIAGCNFFLRRATLERLGGFDDKYLYPAFDDVDLSLRIRKLGLDLAVLGCVPVQHYFSDQARFQNIRTSGRYRFYFLAKNYPLKHLAFLPILDLAYLFDPRHAKRILQRAKFGDARIEAKMRLVPWGQASKRRLPRYLGILSIAVFKIATVCSGYLFAWPDFAAALRHRNQEPDHLAAAEIDAVRDLRASNDRSV